MRYSCKDIDIARWTAAEKEKIRSCLISGLRVFRNAGNSNGGVNEAWRCVGEEMEAAAEAHRLWGIALSEQLAKPLRVSLPKIIATHRVVKGGKDCITVYARSYLT